MKTLIIYDDLESPLKFLIVEGDYSKYNGVVLNSDTDDLAKECNDWFWHNHETSSPTSWTENVAILEAKQFDKVAIITFLP